MSLLSPNRWKHRKQMRLRVEWMATRGTYVSFGDFGMKALNNCYLTNRQLEAARKVIVRFTRKLGKIRLRVFPDVPYTKKWLEMPMGSWKWDVDTFRARIRRWAILFEINWVSREVAQEAFKQASYKLPLQTVTVEKWEIK